MVYTRALRAKENDNDFEEAAPRRAASRTCVRRV